ncbi:hypothetical protein G7Y89_g13571 [Cudoniella acicularis]|uniref:Uncharacterized protein n=1 Tax=Cudoniella acicularis TaxID=354080 RepID=A0A8H4VYJ8_9HELO|nr:hypothetical protein G7Y89_g13571 [Cudoniella acicularis]
MDNNAVDRNAIDQLWWARAQGIVTFIGLGVFILQIWTLLYDRVVRAKAADPGKRASEKAELSYFRVPKLSSWSAFRGYTTQKPRVTMLRGLIEAGDDYLWTSAALDHLPPQHGSLSWVPFYETVYTQIAYSQVSKQNDALLADALQNPITSTALRRSLGDRSGIGNERYKLYNKKLVSCVKPLDKTKDVPMVNYSTRKITKGLTRLADAWVLHGSPCLQTSREEIAALALILGIPLQINDFTQNISGVGPFGTGFDILQDNGRGVWRLELIHGSRIPRHAASCGSGYSILFAKHLAFGSLPFAENKHWVQSIYISPEILIAVRKGYAIKDGKSFGGRPLQILKSLPAAKGIDAFYHSLNDPVPQDRLGQILNSNNSPVVIERSYGPSIHADWARAVVGIAFGGLVPQASRDLAAAVKFTVGGEVFGELLVADLVDKLEIFINQLHYCDTGANIFGDYVTERCDALQLIEYVQYATPSRYDTQEAAAVFARYMNLLERVVVLSNSSMDRIFEAASELIRGVYVEVVLRNRGKSAPAGLSLLGRSLPEEITRLSQSCEPHKPFKGLKMPECTLIVWCILVVWAARVPNGEGDDYRDEGERDGKGGDRNGKIGDEVPRTRRPAALRDLPQLVAFS